MEIHVVTKHFQAVRPQLHSHPDFIFTTLASENLSPMRKESRNHKFIGHRLRCLDRRVELNYQDCGKQCGHPELHAQIRGRERKSFTKSIQWIQK